jgi:hypothetical protein
MAKILLIEDDVPFVVSRKILVKKSSSYCISAAEGGLY